MQERYTLVDLYMRGWTVRDIQTLLLMNEQNVCELDDQTEWDAQVIECIENSDLFRLDNVIHTKLTHSQKRIKRQQKTQEKLIQKVKDTKIVVRQELICEIECKAIEKRKELGLNVSKGLEKNVPTKW